MIVVSSTHRQAFTGTGAVKVSRLSQNESSILARLRDFEAWLRNSLSPCGEGNTESYVGIEVVRVEVVTNGYLAAIG